MENVPVLPAEIANLINLFVLYLVVQGLKRIADQFGFDLTGKGAVIASTISGAVITYANSWLALVPAEYQAIVASALGLLVLVLGAAGVYDAAKRYFGDSPVG